MPDNRGPARGLLRLTALHRQRSRDTETGMTTMTLTYAATRTVHIGRDELAGAGEARELGLAQLLAACQEQLTRFRRRLPSEPQFLLELFRRATEQGDEEAWHGLVGLYRPLLIAQLLQDEVGPAQAEDAVQEAFVMLWLKSRSGAFSTRGRTLAQVLDYLSGSVRFAVIKQRRQQRYLAPFGASELRPCPADGPGAVERSIDMRALLTQLRPLVSAEEWRILWLRFGEAIPPRRLAELIGMPVAKIHLILATAKRRLRNNPQLRSHFVGGEA